MKKLIPFLVVVIFFSLLSFSSRPVSINANSSHKLRSETLNPSVFPLYIKNSKDDSEKTTKFQKLVAAIGDSQIKLVFQFYYDSGYLTLMAYPGPKLHNDNFKWDMRIKLKVLKDCSTIENIDNKSISLGDLELDNEDGNIPALQTLANGSNYIVFIPKLVQKDKEITTINYSIFGFPTLNKDSICKLTNSGFKSALNINPSPPRKGN